MAAFSGWLTILRKDASGVSGSGVSAPSVSSFRALSFIILVRILLNGVMDAYPYAMKQDHDEKEVILYKLLAWCDDPDDWKQVYRKGVKDGIKPRDALKEEYKKLGKSDNV